MGLIKSKQEKELEKKMLIKRTLNEMQRHIQALEKQKGVYISAAKRAKLNGLPAQYELALTGLKMTIKQQKKAQEMMLNFELASQLKDMSAMTQSFLGGMSVLSKEMARLTDSKEFAKVQMDFEKALQGVEVQGEQIEVFLDTNQSQFGSLSQESDGGVSDAELDALLNEQSSQEMVDADSIDKELEKIRKKIEEGQ